MRNHYFKMDAEGTATGGAGDRDYAAEAAKMGHVPKDKWTGDPDKWVEPKAFVEHAEQVLPIIRQQKRALEDEVRTLRAETAQLKKDTAEFAKFVQGASEREKAELETRLAEALAARAAAVTAGDGVEFTKADEAVTAIKTEAAAAGTGKKPDAPKPGDVHPDLPAWLAANPWYESNEELRIEANVMAAAMQQIAAKKGKDLNGKELFNAVAVKMAKLYPDEIKVEEEGTSRSAVETGRDTSPSNDTTQQRRGGAKTYANLPADAKATCERYITNKWTGKKTAEEFRKSFVAEYQWD